MKKYVDLGKYDIQFKSLLSGPAPVGRILNYIIFAGESVLKHKPGSRDLKMEDNIGSAWCIEFMIGLGLVQLSERIPNTNTYNVKLTSSGRKMYNILIENALEPNFNEGGNPELVLKQLKDYGALNIVNKFEEIFRNSPVFVNLCLYLDVQDINERIVKANYSDFKDAFFGEMLLYYENEEYAPKKDGTATTGANRVPSLIQLCQFFKYLDIKDSYLFFDIEVLKNGRFDPEYRLDISDEHFISELEKENKIIEKLSKEFGIAGTRIVIEEVRLTQTQLIFKERLKREYGKRCFLCGMQQDEMLIASHIKPAAKCNIYQKADNNNGLLLCANHDKLFDQNLISFNFTDGSIMISEEISNEDKKLCNINESMKLEESLLTSQRMDYLMWHNEEFYKHGNE